MQTALDVSLDPETAQWVAQEAHRAGVAPETYVAQHLREQHDRALHFSTLSAEEAILLARINEGFPDSFWKRYRELIAHREAQILSDAEQRELITLSDRIEQKNAERVPLLLTLARRRGITLAELIH